MARNSEESAAVAQTPTTATKETESPVATATVTSSTESSTTPALAPSPTTGGREVILTLDEQGAVDYQGPVGAKIRRKDYILKRWGMGVERGPISKELTRLEGRAVPYQIVFQGTRGIPKGTPTVVAAPVAPASTVAAPNADTTAVTTPNEVSADVSSDESLEAVS